MLYVVVFILGLCIGFIFSAAHYKDEIMRARRQSYIEYLSEQENGIE